MILRIRNLFGGGPQRDLFARRPKKLGILPKLISGFDPRGRIARYTFLGLIGAAVLFGLAVAYILLTPKSYTSSMTFILPGSGPGTSVNLNDIGQASSSTSSAFGSSSLSPTENYKKIITSYRVRTAAAELAEVEVWEFPSPSVKLVDQTPLMVIKVSASSPELAQHYAEHLMQAFLQELDELRRGEAAIREAVYRRHIADFREGLKETRGAIMSVQSVAGIVSLDQYNTIVSNLEILRKEIEETQSNLAQTNGKVVALSGLLGINPDLAVHAFTIFTDPTASELTTALNEARRELAAMSTRFGEQHPERQKHARTVDALFAALNERGRALTGLDQSTLAPLFRFAANAERGQLMQELVSSAAEQGALSARIGELNWQITTTEQRIEQLLPVAAELDDLQRDHLVAEAVFSSALARLDTSKTDIFASYPLVQILEAASLPIKPSAPMPKIALAGAFAASVMWVFALVLLWIRLPVLQAILKTV